MSENEFSKPEVEIKQPVVHEAEIKKAVVLDPLSTRTRNAKRNLLVVSGLALMVTVEVTFNIISYKGNDTSLIEGAFAFAVFYLMFSYGIYLIDDLAKYRIYGESTLIKSIRNLYQSIDNDINHINARADSVLGMTSDKSRSSLEELEDSVKSLKRSFKRMNDLFSFYDDTVKDQKKFLYFLDIGLPLTIGVVALFATWDEIPTLVRAIWKSF